MLGQTSHQEKLFRKFRGGDQQSLAEFLELERQQLYDYLMRMTGQVSRSVDTVEEVFQSFSEGAAEMHDSPEELRISLFTTARKFNADVWGANTAKLANAALEDGDSETRSEADEKTLAAFRALDSSLRNLPSAEREVIILRSRCGFEFGAIAEIVGLNELAVESTFYKAMQLIDAECSGVVEGPEKVLAALPVHPMPLQSSQATMNLSVMMHDIKTKPVGLRSPLRIVLLVVVIFLALAWLLFPDLFNLFVSMPLRGLMGHSK